MLYVSRSIQVFGPPTTCRCSVAAPTEGRRRAGSAIASILQSVPPFTQHLFESDGNDSEDQGPAGGRTWMPARNRASTRHALPLFSAFEMGNAAGKRSSRKVRSSPYAGQFKELFGKHIFNTPGAAFDDVLMALEVYQQSPAEFYPYDSKYDAWLRRQATLTAQEERDLTCTMIRARETVKLSPSGQGRRLSGLTDYGYVALGLPRNPAIPANARSQLLRSGAVWTSAPLICPTSPRLRAVPYAFPAERRQAAGVLS